MLDPNAKSLPTSTEAKKIYEKMQKEEHLLEGDKQRLQKVYRHIEMINPIHPLKEQKKEKPKQ